MASKMPVFCRVLVPFLLIATSVSTHQRLMLSSAVAAEADPNTSWTAAEIPADWKKTPGGRYIGGKGFSWYRCYVQVPEQWKGNSLELFIEPVDDARQIWFNGRPVASVGSFPPQFRSGLGGETRHTIPAEQVRAGQLNVLAIRVYKSEGRGGFNVAAPVLFGPDQAIRTAGTWQFRPGDELAWAEPAQPPPTDAAFVYSRLEDAAEVEASLRRLEGDMGPLAPQQSLAMMQVPDDLEIELPLSEPHIGQPLSLKFDERGRMWVTEYRQYPNPAGLQMLSRDMYLRTVYDKVPPPPPHHFVGRDRISIHEDTDRDGVYDKHSTFVDGLSLVSSFAVGRGGVWVLNPPYLLFYPDRNGDDQPDGDPEVHLQGFGIEDSHSIANSLRWGPDGWLYAAQGSTVTGDVKRPGSDEPPVHSMGQLIWRYHPETRRYEIFAEGGGNAFGVEIDAKGRVYSGHNGGNTRGFHYVQGAYYQKGFTKHGSLSNPYAFGYFAAMQHHDVPRFTHTFVIYEALDLPEAYHGDLFGVGPLQSHVVRSEVQRDRSSFKTSDIDHPITTRDTWFRPVDIQLGPDGAIYVADFYEQRIDHASHYQGRVSPDSGRVYRLRAKGAERPEAFDLGRLSTSELIEVLRHPNRWHRQTAQRLFGDRKDRSAIPQLRQAIADNTGQFALEALWALNLSGGFNEQVATELLQHDDPYVRLWAARLASDDGELSEQLAGKMAELAADEPNVEVRSQLASSARRLTAERGLPIVRRLLTRSEDVDDIHVPMLLWWAIESKAGSHPQQVLALLEESPMWEQPLVQQHILDRLMRRYAMAGTRKDLLVCAQLLQLAPQSKHAEALMQGFEKAFEGRSLAELPQELVDAIARFGGGSLPLQLRRGDEQAVARALNIIADPKADAEQRRQLIEILGQTQPEGAVEPLLTVFETSDNTALQNAALTALQSFDDSEIARRVLARYSQLNADVLSTAHTLLTSRKAWAAQLVQAVNDGAVPADNVPAPIVRKILLHQDKNLHAMVQKTWGQVDGGTTEQMREEIDRLAKVIAAASGNPYDGKRLFLENCGKCHQLFGEGGRIGPDLTSYKRDDLHSILLHVVNPSAEIREGFENYVVLTDDGRALNGFIVDQDNRVVILRGADGQSVVIPRDQIEDLRAISRSLMPEDILKPFNNQQIRDLFGYLRATQPLPQ